MCLFARGGEGDEEIAERIVARGLAAPAIFLLETIKPVAFIAGSALTVLSPVGRAFFDAAEWDALPDFLEDRERIEGLLCRIERKMDEAR